MSFRIHKAFINLQSTNEDIFDEIFLSLHWLHNFHVDFSKSLWGDHKTNPYELSGLFQMFISEDTQSLYIMNRCIVLFQDFEDKDYTTNLHNSMPSDSMGK